MNAPSKSTDEDGFDRIAEIARKAVRDKVRGMLEQPLVAAHPEATQAVVLGALAGAVESIVCASRDDVSREHLKDSIRNVVTDFVDQAKDQLLAGRIQ